MDLNYYKRYYCSDIENVENYQKAKKDNFIGWECHHRREAEFSRKELIALGMYYNISSEELIFLTRAEHNKLHKKGNSYMLGKHHTEEAKRKMREKAKGRLHTEETKKKIGEANKGNTAIKDRHWYNNGKINIMAYECPEGFTPGRIPWKK